jgi:nitrate reductase / nitrite oxidoreductase, beta subunit
VGRIRYVGVLLYDAERIAEVAAAPDDRLLDAHRSLILDPHDPEVVVAARQGGVPDGTIEAAQASPVYRFVKEWRLALPLHVEFRTLPTLFYVPPLSPVLATLREGEFENLDAGFFQAPEQARLPLRFLAAMFGAGSEEPVRYALRKQQAVRAHRRRVTVGDIGAESAGRALAEADCTAADADAIHRLTSLSRAADRVVLPPGARESAIAAAEDPMQHKQSAGFGFMSRPRDRS